MLIKSLRRFVPAKPVVQAAVQGMLVVAALVVLADPALAQVGGATGTGAATGARVTAVLTTFQQIMFGIGGFVLAAAFMYTGYSLAWGGKKWSDVANVSYGAMIAGMGALLVGWFFS